MKKQNVVSVSEVIEQACIDQYGENYKFDGRDVQKWNKMCDEIGLCRDESSSMEINLEEVEEEIEDGDDSIENKALVNLMKKLKVETILVTRD